MIGFLLQLSSILEVLPAWLPPISIAVGFVSLSVGMGRKYFAGTFSDWQGYSPSIAWIFAICSTGSVSGALYITILRQDLTLLFVFFTFIGGRIIQGALTARIIQKVIDFILSSSSSNKSYITRACEYVKSKIKERVTFFVATSIITLYTALSIISVYTIGTGELMDAIERFWVGFFYLIVIGLVFDFRHFSHRISWTAGIGLIIAVTGAFLYQPAGFSTYTVALAPYLDNPIPDWMRWPLGAIGILFGFIFWAVFYINEDRL